MSERTILVVVMAMLASSTAAAQEFIPLPSSTPALSLGLEHLQGAVLRVAFAPGERSTARHSAMPLGPTVAVRLDPAAGVVGVELGAQASQAITDTFFVREAVAVGPVVGAVPIGAGVAGGGLVTVGAHLGDVVVVAGPRVFGTALVVGPVPGRVVVDGVVGVVVPLSDALAVSGGVSAGAEVPHVGGVLSKQGAVVGSAVVGVQLRW